MSDPTPYDATRPRRSFVPDMYLLEQRSLLSASTHAIGAPPFLKEEPPPPPPLPPPPPPPRQGGTFIQDGSVVGIAVGQPKGNTVQITDLGAGNYRAEWNSGPVHSFKGVRGIYVYTTRATNNQVAINLDEPSAASPEAKLGPDARTEAATATVGAHPLAPVMGGTAVRNGTELTVTVTRRSSNTVQIFDQAGVLWRSNGMAARSMRSSARSPSMCRPSGPRTIASSFTRRRFDLQLSPPFPQGESP